MDLAKINETISDYFKIIDLVRAKCDVLESADNQYNTLMGIEEINFYNDGSNLVNVTCDATIFGCYDSHTYSFPIEWLAKSDEELKEIVILAKKEREEKERIQKEEEKRKQKEDKELSDLREFKRLKAKFEK